VYSTFDTFEGVVVVLWRMIWVFLEALDRLKLQANAPTWIALAH